MRPLVRPGHMEKLLLVAMPTSASMSPRVWGAPMPPYSGSWMRAGTPVSR